MKFQTFALYIILAFNGHGFDSESSDDDLAPLTYDESLIEIDRELGLTQSISQAASWAAINMLKPVLSRVITRSMFPINGNASSKEYWPKGWDLGFPTDTHRVSTKMADGTIIQGSLCLVNKSSPLVLMFHGSSSCADRQGEKACFLAKEGFSSLAFTIPGNPGSNGSSLDYTYSSPLFIDACIQFALKEGFDLNHMAVMGTSIGGAYAAYAARYYKLPCILDRTFTKPSHIPMNLSGVWFPETALDWLIDLNASWHQKPQLPECDFPPNNFNNLEHLQAMAANDIPVFIVYGDNDFLMGKKYRAEQLAVARYGPNYSPDNMVGIRKGAHDVETSSSPRITYRITLFLKRVFSEQGYPPQE